MQQSDLGAIRAICRYPVKGLPPEHLDRITLAADAAMPGDRRLALTHGASEFDPARPAWVKRKNFVVVALSPALAALRLKAEGDTLTLIAPDAKPCKVDLATPEGRTALAIWIADHSDQSGPFEIAQVPTQPLHDTPLPAVSVMSDTSLAALSAAAGMPLDRQRFRGNLWVEGGVPWRENSLVGQHFRIGDTLFEGLEPIERCRAVDANPATGERDTDLCRHLHTLTGAPNFGILARVVETGRVELGHVLNAG